MSVQRLSFKPKLWSIAITLIFTSIFLALGNWQLNRADEKNARQQKLDLLSNQPPVSLPKSPVELDDYLYRKVEILGEFLSDFSIYLDNRIYQGVAGYHVITPVRLANSNMHVLVNRGWVETGFDRTVLPDVPESFDEVNITGTVVSPETRMLKLSDHVISGLVWENLYLQRYQEMTGLELQPILVLQEDKTEDGLIRDWKSPGSGSERNLGYAVQWFSLAATTVIIFLVLNVKRKYTEIE